MQGKTDELVRRLQSLDEAQGRVEQHLEEAHFEAEVKEAADFRSKVSEALYFAEEVLEHIRATKVPLPDEGATEATSVGSKVNANLPKLELPVFSGLLTEWQPFWDQFIAIIDKSAELPEVVKFTYLRSLLKGEAKSVISGLSLTAAHYETAKTSLEQRYGRKERLIFEHINALMNVAAPSKPSVKELWSLKDELESHVHSLKALGVTGEKYGVILTPLILARLPVEIRLEWARNEGHEDDLAFLLQFLKQEIERQERSQAYSAMMKQQAAVKPSQDSVSVQGTATALQVVVGCGICGKDHSTSQCFRLTRTAVRNRRPVVRNAKLCYACLESGHMVSSCSQGCSKCGGAHHAVLCRPPKDAAENQVVASRPETDAVVQARANVAAESAQVIMQVAKVKVPHSDAVVNVCFDTGSDRTFVSTGALKFLRPQFVRSEHLSYSAFGLHDRSQLNTRNVYSIQLQGTDTIETIEACEVPVICAPLRRRSVQPELLETIGIDCQLCNATDASIRVDILIGLDWYWRLVNPDSRLVGENLVLQSTKFGCLVSGSFEKVSDAAPNTLVHFSHSMLTFDSFRRTEYLRLLPSPACNRSHYKLREGSVVLVEDAQLPKHRWPLAVVEKTHRGRDGRIRAVDLRTRKGLMTRSINRLRDLEIP